MRHRSHLRPGDAGLAARLRREIEGEVWFDPASRGRYSTDASIYQVEPIGVVAPRSAEDIAHTIAICREAGAPVLPRGAGTSQCGQTVGEAVVVDTSKHLDRVLGLDEESRRITVEPGIVLDRLNAWLKPKGLFFPVDVSPANRATIGGMAGNNSCGSRSIRYGNMVHNVHAISAVLAGGSAIRFGEVSGNLAGFTGDDHYSDLIRRMRALGAREADEIGRRFPRLLRRVGGYNIDTLVPGGAASGMADDMTAGVANGMVDRVTDGTTGAMAGNADRGTTGAFARPVTGAHNMARLLVGSEGTLGFFTEVELDLQPIPAHRVLGICHFPAFHDAMSATQHIVALGPSAVELVDRTLVELARDIEAFRPTVERFVRGAPDALLLVEFAGEDRGALLSRLARLVELMADLGYPGAVVEAVEPAFQRAVWDVRKAGLNIMMSMKGDGKPVSFVEDCAVRLEDLAEYTRRLDEIFARHGTRGTWYAHASVGTLHVRPIIDLKVEDGARSMRAIAEECFEMVREYRGSHSGEHGDGIVRSEFHEAMFGPRLTGAFEEVKDAFDPDGLFNPGKIVRPERMDDRELFRYKPGYAPLPVETGSRLVGVGGLRPRGRDVQQQRRVPQVGARRDVSLVPGDHGRAARHPGAREHPAARADRSARPQRPHLRRDGGDDGALRRLQGLQARVPDRRRHGADEDRVPASAPEAARGTTLRDRLVASLPTLRPRRQPARMADEPARSATGAPGGDTSASWG